ncbi:10891_t:CDS:1, partial [Funneliformis caledonium]
RRKGISKMKMMLESMESMVASDLAMASVSLDMVDLTLIFLDLALMYFLFAAVSSECIQSKILKNLLIAAFAPLKRQRHG